MITDYSSSSRSRILFPRHATRPINVTAARFFTNTKRKLYRKKNIFFITSVLNERRFMVTGLLLSDNAVGRRPISNRGCAIIMRRRLLEINPDQSRRSQPVDNVCRLWCYKIMCCAVLVQIFCAPNYLLTHIVMKWWLMKNVVTDTNIISGHNFQCFDFKNNFETNLLRFVGVLKIKSNQIQKQVPSILHSTYTIYYNIYT